MFKITALIITMVLLLTQICFSGGVTIITHGYMSGADDFSWVSSMGFAIEMHSGLLNNTTRYTVTVTDPGIEGIGDLEVEAIKTYGDNPLNCPTGEIIILLDWSDVDTLLAFTSTRKVASFFTEKLLSPSFFPELTGKSIVELPIHLIGHSRGGSLVCEIARLLGRQGIIVDQVTTLDPHPVFDLSGSDADALVYENVLFADNYWQEYGSYSLPDPDGRPLSGAYNRYLPHEDMIIGGYLLEHSNVHLWYYGTINLSGGNIDKPIDSNMRSQWWKLYENRGDNTGFNFSRIKGGNRLSTYSPNSESNRVIDGYDSRFGGTGARTVLDMTEANWPNIFICKVLNLPVITKGDALQIQYYGQDYNSESTVELYFDRDRNPYNGNNRISSPIYSKTHAATGKYRYVETANVSTSSFPSAGGYIYAKVFDNAHTRYMYAPTKLSFIEPDVTLSSIQITGVNQLDENSGAQYTCTAYYSDGSSSDITTNASWSETSGYASISNTGYLSTDSVSSDQSCTITASYQGKSDTHNVLIKNIPPVLSFIAISGSAEVTEQTGSNYTCRAYYSDGSSSDVTGEAAWSSNPSSYASFSTLPGQEGYLWANSVTQDQTCTITAGYQGKSDNAEITIKDFVDTLQGSGTQNDPYLITSLQDFDTFANNSGYWYAYARLETDVDLSGRTYTTAVIGKDTSSASGFQGEPFFSCNFDGNNHTIRNFTINTGGANNCFLGLFGDVDNASVNNLTLENCNITGGSNSEYVGTIVGRNAGTVRNCRVTGTVKGGNYTGGLVGYNWYGNIYYSSSSAIITGYSGSQHMGGLVGRMFYGNLSNSYSTGNVSGYSFVGGFLGSNSNGSANNCYSTGSASGLVYGGFLAFGSSGNVTNCFWDVNTSGATISAAGTGKTTAQMKYISIYSSAGWSIIDNVQQAADWFMPENDYPILYWQIDYTQIPLSLEILGPARIAENSIQQYSCIAHYLDNYFIDVTNSVEWSIKMGNATIDSSGMLSSGEVLTSEKCVLVAKYRQNSDAHNTNIQNIESPFATHERIYGWGHQKLPNQEMSNLVEISAGGGHSVARKSDGISVVWGANDAGQVNAPTETNFKQIVAGYMHTLAIRSDGSLIAWGSNEEGESNVPSGNNFVEVAGGYEFSIALKDDGSLVGWGDDVSGQIAVPSGNDFVDISASYQHTIALKSDGSLASWGNDSFGQITNTPSGNDFVAIAAGGRFSLALKSDGRIVGWGENGDGQTTVPAGNDFVAIAAGGFHGLALKSDGSLVGWGSNSNSQISVPTGSNFIAIAAGYRHSLALKSDGTLVGWGDNGYGQASIPPDGDYDSVALGSSHGLALKSDGSLVGWGDDYYGQATIPMGNDYIDIAAGWSFSLALKSDGSLAGWGYNAYGQATVPGGKDYIDVGAGWYYSLALKSDGRIVSWGSDYDGQVTNTPSGNDFAAIAAGGFHGLALKSDGSLAGWGYNAYGQATVPSGNDFVAIAAGGFHSLALKTDGSLVAWGDNGNGQSTVPPGNDFVAIAAGYYHSLALKFDGTIVAWGSNSQSQISVSSDNGFIAVAAGGACSLAIKKIENDFLQIDLFKDGIINFLDFSILASQWKCASNVNDLIIMAEHWLEGASGIFDGLVAHWSFDNVSDLGHDDSGNGYNGTVYGAQSVSDGSKQALSFDGENDYVESGFTDVLGNTFTISVWYRSSQKPTKSNAIIERAAGKDSFSYLECLRINENGYIEGQARNGNHPGQTCNITGTNNLADGVWHHIVFTRSPSEAVVYVDGAIIGTHTGIYDPSVLATEFYMGKTYDSIPRYLNMTLDEVLIYNRVLSAAEIQSLYQNP